MNPCQLAIANIISDGCAGSTDRELLATRKRILRSLTDELGIYLSRRELRRGIRDLSAEGFITVRLPDPGPGLSGKLETASIYGITSKLIDYLKGLEAAEDLPANGVQGPPGPKAVKVLNVRLDRKPAAILEYLISLMIHFKKAYVFPSQDTILRHLRAWYGVTMHKSTLNRWLARLEISGFIERINRNTAEKLASGRPQSTLYKLTFKARKWAEKAYSLASAFFAVFGFSRMRNNSPQTGRSSGGNPPIFPPDDGPDQQKGGPPAASSHSPPLSREENLSQLGELLKKIG